MRDMLQFYIDGKWVDPVTPNPFPVINPATEEVCGRISLGSSADVDKAVAAAKRAGPAFAATSREERIALLEKILEVFATRHDEVATAIMEEINPFLIYPGLYPSLGSLRSTVCLRFPQSCIRPSPEGMTFSVSVESLR